MTRCQLFGHQVQIFFFGSVHCLSVHHARACDNSSAVHKDEYVHDWLLSTGSSALDSALHFHDDIFSNIPTFQEDALTYNEHIVKPLSHFHIQTHLKNLARTYTGPGKWGREFHHPISTPYGHIFK